MFEKESIPGVFRVIGVIILIISILGGIIVGITTGSFLTFIILILSGFLNCVIMSAIAAVIEYLGEIERNTREMNSQILKLASTGNPAEVRPASPQTPAQPSYFALAKEKPKTTSSGEWICPKCGMKNSKHELSCKDCGYYK